MHSNSPARTGINASRLTASDTSLDRGLALLEQGWQYASRLQTTPWQFAVDLNELVTIGTTRNDLRWLHAHGLVECGLDITAPGEPARRIRQVRGCLFAANACYVMTKSAFESVALRRAQLQSLKVVRLEPGGPVLRASGRGDQGDYTALASPNNANANTPIWDGPAKQLIFDGQVVKEFRGPAANQLVILAEFQRQGWPVRIDDPLPGGGEQAPKRRLNDTIRTLNRNHLVAVLRFAGDGTGEGVLWRVIAPSRYDGRRR